MSESYLEEMELKGKLQVTSWQEDDIRTLADECGKVTRASIGYRMTGDLDGEGVEDVVMYYRPDGTATVVGLWHLTGSTNGRAGSVLFATNGDYDGTTARSQVSSVLGSGSAGFASLHGSGTTAATNENVEYTLELEF